MTRPQLDLVESDSLPGVFGPSQTCYDRTVTGCTLAPQLSAEIRVTGNEGTDGTIFFLSAGSGTAFWAPALQGDPPVPGPQHLLQVDLTTGDNDYKLVEIAWQGAWDSGAEQQRPGQGRLACRPATLINWLIGNEVFHKADTDVCGTGQSGGANQVAYSITHFPLAGKFKGLVFTSGPTYGNLQRACSQECDVPGDPPYPETEDGCFDAASRWRVDQAYGQADEPTFPQVCQTQGDPEATEECGESTFLLPASPCMQHAHLTDPVFEDLFFTHSIALDEERWNYDYPAELGLRFLFGETDRESAPWQQNVFFEAVDHNADVDRSMVLAGHNIPADDDGRDEIMEALAICNVVSP